MVEHGLEERSLLRENLLGTNDGIVTLNVGGLRFQTRRSTLRRYPETLLGSDELESYYEPDLKEYFFDRNRTIFESILGYYLSNGVMCLPASVNPDIFIEELKFFKMGRSVIRKFDIPNEQDGIDNCTDRFWHPIQEKIWLLFDNPGSSILAKGLSYFDLIVILTAIAAQCIESLPDIRIAIQKEKVIHSQGMAQTSTSTELLALLIVETVSNVWFTINFLARVISCPDKKVFAKSVLNWFDILSILPFYLDIIFTSEQNLSFLMILRFFRTLRIVRIFKMSRYFQGLFALGYALGRSAGELVILALMLVTFVVLFSSLIFFTDSCDVETDKSNSLNITYDFDDPDCQFHSIITGFWWSVITMSTVGYGDYAPKTALGKVVGSICALTGILIISLPFPLIITRFNNFMRLQSCGDSRYSSIENGLTDGDPIIPEYSGVAYGFLSKDSLSRVAQQQIHNDINYNAKEIHPSVSI